MTIIFTIFKILLFIILGILGLLLAIILLALISPIRYEADGGIHNVKASVSWFYRMIRIKFSYEKEILSYKAYLLFFRVFDSNPEDSENKDKPDKKRVSVIDIILIPLRGIKRFIKKRTTKVVEKEVPKQTVPEIKKPEVLKETYKETDKKIELVKAEPPKPEPIKMEQKVNEDISDKQEKHEHKSEKKSNKSTDKSTEKKRKFSIKDTYQYIIKLWNYEDRAEIVHATLNFVKREFRLIKPDLFEIYGDLGFEDPYNTGILLGLVCQINEFFDNFIKINFEFCEQKTDLYAKIKGKLRLGSLILAFIKYILSKPIFKIVKRILRKRKQAKTERKNRYRRITNE